MFGQAVLNVHKNVISLLLLEPKTWNTLSRQARERFVQIYQWLHDKNGLKRISDFLEAQSCEYNYVIFVKISFYIQIFSIFFCR